MSKNRWQKLWQQKKHIESVVETNHFDVLEWQDAQEMLPACRYSNQDSINTFGSEAVRDAFWTIYKASPKIKPPQGMEALGRIFSAGMATPGYEKLHREGQGDVLASAVGAKFFCDELKNIVPEELKEQMAEGVKQAEMLEALIDDLAALGDLLEAVGGKDKDLKKEITKQQKAAAQAEQALEAAQQAAERLINKNEGVMTAQMNKAASEAADEAAEVAEFMQGFSESAGGMPGRVSPEVARSAMQLLKKNPHLQKIAEFLGWAKKTAKAAWRDNAKGRSEFTGYKPQEIEASSLASWEFADMVSQSPLRKLGFMARVADGGVYHRNYKGAEPKNRGGMIIVRDESGSMSGSPHALAVATEWALLEIARKDNRPFFSVPFSYYHHVWDAQKDASPEAVIRHLEHFYNGGTWPWDALTTALNLVDEGELEADILMITDEAFGTPDKEFLKALEAAKKRRPVKIVVIVIGYGTGQVKWADKVILLHDFVQEKDQLKEAFELVT